MQPALQEGYRYLEVCTSWGGVRQRWLVVWSAQAEQRERATLQKQLEKEKERAEKAWQALCRQEFSSPEEAAAAVQALEKWHYHRLEVRYQPVMHYARRGRPSADTAPQRVGFRLQGKVVEKAEETATVKALGKFILATNELDEQQLPAEEMLRAYKGQGVGPERGFRFLKAPWFFADSLFLKSPRRIMALVMVMGLALLVYALAERKVRLALQEKGESIPNQVGKPTQSPTMRRIFQMFEGIDVLLIPAEGGASNGSSTFSLSIAESFASSASTWKNAIRTPVRCGMWDKGITFNIQRFSTEDGPGIRTTVFLKGCPLRCACATTRRGSPPVRTGLVRRPLYRRADCLRACPVGALELTPRGCG